MFFSLFCSLLIFVLTLSIFLEALFPIRPITKDTTTFYHTSKLYSVVKYSLPSVMN